MRATSSVRVNVEWFYVVQIAFFSRRSKVRALFEGDGRFLEHMAKFAVTPDKFFNRDIKIMQQRIACKLCELHTGGRTFHGVPYDHLCRVKDGKFEASSDFRGTTGSIAN